QAQLQVLRRIPRRDVREIAGGRVTRAAAALAVEVRLARRGVPDDDVDRLRVAAGLLGDALMEELRQLLDLRRRERERRHALRGDAGRHDLADLLPLPVPRDDERADEVAAALAAARVEAVAERAILHERVLPRGGLHGIDRGLVG